MPIEALFVSKIDHKSQHIQVYSNSNCLPWLLLSGFNNRSLINSPFQFRNKGKNSKNYTQLKCTSGSRSCSTLLIPSHSEIEDFQDGVIFCTKMIEFKSVLDQIYKLLSRGYDGLNIPLSWSTPDCRHCEAKGKGCKLKKGSAETECFASIKEHCSKNFGFWSSKVDFQGSKCSVDGYSYRNLGYIAPEVFSRNFGNVSYKSDVSSFGMSLLEMVGGRKNINATDQESMDGLYYPEWIINLLEGDDFRVLIEEEGSANIAKKLAIACLWCIQWQPVGRPTMKVVIQMLEGEKN